MITVFTPAYNRAGFLPRLFRSLEEQTCKQFEWLIVDDGSTDRTAAVVQDLISSASFPVRYFRQPNGGKHRAINRAVTLARGELFLIVDSDDYLTPNAIDRLIFHYNAVRSDLSVAGVFGLRRHADGRINGLRRPFSVLHTTPGRIKRYLRRDVAEAIRLSVLRAYPFPEFEAEKFISESAVWNEIAKTHVFRYFYEPVIVCDYLPDGLTCNIVGLHRANPLGTLLVYKEKIAATPLLVEKLKSVLNYWRYRPCAKSCPEALRLHGPALFFAPLGFLLYILDSLTRYLSR